MPEIQPSRKQSPLTISPQLEAILLSQGTLGKWETLLVLPWGGRGGAAGLQGVGTWDAANHPAVHRTVPRSKELSSPECR